MAYVAVRSPSDSRDVRDRLLPGDYTESAAAAAAAAAAAHSAALSLRSDLVSPPLQRSGSPPRSRYPVYLDRRPAAAAAAGAPAATTPTPASYHTYLPSPRTVSPTRQHLPPYLRSPHAAVPVAAPQTSAQARQQRRTPGLRASAVVGAIVVAAAAAVEDRRRRGGGRREDYDDDALSLASYPLSMYEEKPPPAAAAKGGWLSGLAATLTGWMGGGSKGAAGAAGSGGEVVASGGGDGGGGAARASDDGDREAEIEDLKRQMDLLYSEIERRGAETSEIKSVLTDYNDVVFSVVARSRVTERRALEALAAAESQRRLGGRSPSPGGVFHDCLEFSPPRRTDSPRAGLATDADIVTAAAAAAAAATAAATSGTTAGSPHHSIRRLEAELRDARARAEAAEGGAAAAAHCAASAIAEAEAAVAASAASPLAAEYIRALSQGGSGADAAAAAGAAAGAAAAQPSRYAAGTAAAAQLLLSTTLPIVQWRCDGSVTQDNCGHLHTEYSYVLAFRDVGAATDVYVWQGRHAKAASRAKALQKANDFCLRSPQNATWRVCEEGHEPASLLMQLVSCGRRLVVRRTHDAVFALKVAKVADTYVKLVEVSRSPVCMSSDSVILLCCAGRLAYVWQGVAACVWRRSAAVQEASGLADAVVTVDEGAEPPQFLADMCEPDALGEPAGSDAEVEAPAGFRRAAEHLERRGEEWVPFDPAVMTMQDSRDYIILTEKENFMILSPEANAAVCYEAAQHLFRPRTPVTAIRHTQLVMRDGILNGVVP